MNSKEFLKSKLFALSAEYPKCFVKYYFDSFDNDHFVCIQPKEELENIIKNEAQAIDSEFIKLYPYESLSFIEIDPNLVFDELVYKYSPAAFIENKRVNISQFLKKYFYHYSEKSSYDEPLYPVRNIASEEVYIEKEDDEFAFAA